MDISDYEQTGAALRTSEERHAFLLSLSDAVKPLIDPLEVQDTTMRMLGEHLRVTRSFYFENQPDDDQVQVGRGYLTDPVPIPDRLRISDFGELFVTWYRLGKTVVVNDSEQDPRVDESGRAAFRAIGTRAGVGVPLVKGGRLVAVLGVHQPEPRDWTPDEVQLLEAVAERTWAAVEKTRAEAALRASEEKYRTLFASIDESFCIIEVLFDEHDRPVDYVFLETNPVFEEQTGIKNAIGRRMREIAPAHEEHWFDIYGRIVRTGESQRFQNTAVALGREYDVFAFRIGPAEARRVGVLFNDITKRKRSEANLAFLNEVSEDLVRLTTIDETMNALGEKIGGHFNAPLVAFSEVDEAQEVITVDHAWNCADLPGLRGVYRISDFHTEDFRQASRAGETYVVRDAAVDRRTDAEAMAALNIASFVSVPLLREGRWRFQLTVFDATPRDWREDEIELMRELTMRIWTRLERARAEQALRESEDRYRTLFDVMDEGYCIIEVLFDDRRQAVDYRFIEVNGSFERQAGMRNVAGRRMLEFVPSIEEHWLKNYGDVALTGRAVRFSGEYRGLGRWFDVNAFRAESWPEHHIAVLFSDITRRHQTEEELRNADRRKDEFLATLAHELRNPLAPLRNGLEVVKRARTSPEAVDQALAMMERQLGQMVHLIDDLMDMSRITRGKVELRKSRVELARIVHQAVETSRPLMEVRNHDFILNIPPEPIYLDGDVTRLAQVFSNLLNNAARYSERGGTIRLSAVRRDEDVLVSVKDNGVGIPAHMLPKVFDIFTQVDPSLERAQGGLGIGLSLVKKLVEMHGGSVGASSEGHGKGSEFVVTLPMASAPARNAEPADHEGTATKSAKRRILVADDNADSASSLAMLLELLGNEVRTANDGLRAVEIAAAFRPDVALLDIGMPKLNGLEACRRIREQPWGKSMALVALTGWGQEDDKRQTREAGFDHHIVKPVNAATLDKLLAEVCAG